MTIDIIETTEITENGVIDSRNAIISITDTVDVYLWSVGGLPATGDLQVILDAREAELWAAASSAANAVPVEVELKQEARQFMADNPNAKQLIELSLTDLLTAIDTRTAGQETLLLKTLAVAVRYLYEASKLK